MTVNIVFSFSWSIQLFVSFLCFSYVAFHSKLFMVFIFVYGMKGTIDAVLRGRYFLPSGKPVNLDKKVRVTCA